MTVRRTLAPCPQHIPAPDRDAYLMNALEELGQARSFTMSELSDTPADYFIRNRILLFMENAELNLRKALA